MTAAVDPSPVAPVTTARSTPGSPQVDTVVETPGATLAVRFDRAERWLHWTNAALVLVLIATGSLMYIGSLAGLVGRRVLVERVHLWSGLALPVPFALVLLGRWNRGFRRDARRVGRFLDHDWLWFRARFRRSGRLRIGKFNAGQKANAILVAAALPVMLGTGLLLNWATSLPDTYRTGATFVHDWGYVALSLLVTGHILKAIADPVSLRSMVRGTVPLRWAREERPRWHDELVGAPPDGARLTSPRDSASATALPIDADPTGGEPVRAPYDGARFDQP